MIHAHKYPHLAVQAFSRGVWRFAGLWVGGCRGLDMPARQDWMQPGTMGVRFGDLG